MMVLSWPAMSQDRDSLLRRINQIKKDTDRYLYGLATLPGDPNPESSREQAAKELKVQVDQYLDSDQFVFLKEKKEYPAEIVESVSCLLRPDTYRSIVFVEKARLLEAENKLAEQLGSDTRKEELATFVNGILAANKVDEILNLIATSPLAAEIKAGQKIDNNTQQYVNDGILVYFDPKSKKVLEIMTPMDESYARKNARTGAPAYPMRYKNAPLWVYIEGLKTSNVL